MRIPEGPEDLTAQWLTRALRISGTIQKAKVLSVRADAVGQERGITAQIYRLYLVYDVEEEGTPGTLVAKFPTDSGLQAEVLFYRQLAGEIEMPTPRCYYAEGSETGRSALLLEDLAPARSGDTITHDDLPKAKLAVRQIARLHASWWEDPRLDELGWLGRLDGAQVERLVDPRWGPFLQRAGHLLPDRRIIERVREHLAYLTDHLYVQPPRTLLHHDYQPNNLFPATPDGGVPFAVIDWQSVAHGRGTSEVAFYLCRGASSHERRAIETELLETYHATLAENGVQAYTLEQCVEDYRLSMLMHLARAGYVIGGNLSPTHQRRFVDIYLPRACAAVTDLDAVALLPE